MTKLTLKILCLFVFAMVCSHRAAFASSFLCSRIYQPDPGSHPDYYAKQVVFSSAKLDELLSSLAQEKGSESKAALLAHMKAAGGHDFKILRERISLATETIETLASDSHFNKLNDRTKALVYRDITDALFSTTAPEGLRSLFWGENHLYFASIEKDSPTALFIKWAGELRSGGIDIADRQQMSATMQAYTTEMLKSLKQFANVDSQMALIHLTYRKGPARADEITNYALNLVKALNNYELSLVLRVNDIPVNEAEYLNAQLSKIQDELNLVYNAMSPDQRLSLQIERLMKNLSRYQEKLRREIALYPERETESLQLAAMWTRMVKNSNSLPVDPY